MKKIDDVFISHASDILADTNSGLSGSQIIKECNSYAIDFNVSIPVTSPDFGKFGSIIPNKRTALYKNLREFNGKQQFIIIKKLCELPIFEGNKKAEDIIFRIKILSLFIHSTVISDCATNLLEEYISPYNCSVMPGGRSAERIASAYRT